MIRASTRRSLLRRWTTVLFAAAFTLGVNALWDYREANRVSSTIDRLKAAGGRVSSRPANAPSMAGGAEQDAGSLYTAAAVLAASRTATIDSMTKAVDASVAAGVGSPVELSAGMDTLIDNSRQTFDLLDRATRLPFAGFAPGSAYASRWWQLGNLYHLAGLRTQYLALKADSVTVTASVITELGVIRSNGVLSDAILPSRFPSAEHVALVLSRTSVADADLIAIAKGLRDAADDQALTRQLELRRARSIELFLARARYGSAFSWDWMLRPLAARAFLQNLDAYGQKLNTTARPWPERLDVATGAQSGSVKWFAGWIGEPAGLWEEAIRVVALDLAGIRAAELAIAVERYRRANGGNFPTAVEQLAPAFIDALPIDPYSGQPMRFQSTATEFVVYSVGADRTDNNGNITGAAAVGFTAASRQAQQPVGDIGLKIAKKTGQ